MKINSQEFDTADFLRLFTRKNIEMATRKITLNELKAMVRQIVKEETEENTGPRFIEYKGEKIMYEPTYGEYFYDDIQFDSLEDAKRHIDSGSETPDWKLDAYRRGLM